MKHTVTEVVLNNGAKGLFVHIPNATVMSFEISFRAGDYLVDKTKWETPHLMEHILLGANELVPKAKAFQAEFEKNGAYNNASTSAYDITYEAECADFEWDRIAGLLQTAITKPLFLDEEFEAEFGNVREELTSRSNNHFRHLSLAMREACGFVALTDHQRVQLMDNVNIQDVRNHYKRTHTTRNMRFVIAGNLPHARQRQLSNLFQQTELPNGEGRLEMPTEIPKSLTSPLYIANETVENIYFNLDTFMLRRLTDPESDALQLINSMLTETLYSRILGTARERGLVYGMSSGIAQTKNSSNWWFCAQVMPKNAIALIDIIKEELLKVRAGKLSDQDVADAKQYALGKYQRSGQTVSGTAAGYSNRYFFEEIIDDYYKIPARIEAIQKADITCIVEAMFNGNIWGFGGLGSCGDDFLGGLHKELSPLWP
ncbi:MAG: pitrilysin family protein [Patescibacteria group bacterium]